MHLSIWLALLAYAGRAVCLAMARSPLDPPGLARWFWTIGLACYWVHVFSAFHSYHDWSHQVAWEATARQTHEVVGWDWGGGIWVNYLFTLAWTLDAAWWWFRPSSYRNRPAWLSVSWEFLFFFMVLNGAVLFGTGWSRWAGSGLCLLVVGTWLIRWKNRRNQNSLT